MEFTEQALRTLPCAREVARILSNQPDIGEELAFNWHLREVRLFGFRLIYLVEEDGILVLTARQAA